MFNTSSHGGQRLIEFGRFLERHPMIEEEEELPEPPLPIADAIRL